MRPAADAPRRGRTESYRHRHASARLMGFVAVGLVGAIAAGCNFEEERELPTRPQLEGIYGEPTVRLNGNVVEVRAEQDPGQLRRGGTLWAKVGPYIYLFSPQTQELFNEFSGVAAVRVHTLDGQGGQVAEAMLTRDELTSVTWREANQHVGRARNEGTQSPGYLEDLVRYGERRTTYEYSPRYVDE